MLLVSGVAIGIGYGGGTTLANGVIAAAYESRRSTFLPNLQNGVFGLGAVLGPICMAALPDGSGRLAWLGYAGVAVLAGALFTALPLTSLASPGRIVPDAPDPLTTGPVRVGRLGGFAVLFACFVAAEISSAAWATTHLDAIGADVTAVALATSLFYLGLATGRLSAAVVGLRVDPGPLLVGATVLASAMLVLSYVAPWGGAAYILVGLAIGPVFPTGLAWVSADQAHARHPIATVLIAGNLGGIALPPAVGVVIVTLGAQAAPLPIAATAARGAVVAVLLVRGAGSRHADPDSPLSG